MHPFVATAPRFGCSEDADGYEMAWDSDRKHNRYPRSSPARTPPQNTLSRHASCVQSCAVLYLALGPWGAFQADNSYISHSYSRPYTLEIGLFGLRRCATLERPFELTGMAESCASRRYSSPYRRGHGIPDVFECTEPDRDILGRCGCEDVGPSYAEGYRRARDRICDILARGKDIVHQEHLESTSDVESQDENGSCVLRGSDMNLNTAF